MTNEDVPELQSIWDGARRFIERGDYDKAIEIYQYILIRYSDYPIAVEHANAYLGDIFLTLRQLNTVEEHIKKAIGFSSEKPSYHYILGFIYSNKRRWNKAIADFVDYYNYCRYHKALGDVTPADVLYGRREQILQRSKEVQIQTTNRRRNYNRDLRELVNAA